LLHLGLDLMVVRYPLAALVGYLAFLWMVWRLVRTYRQRADAEIAATGRQPPNALPRRDTSDLTPDSLDFCFDTDADGCLIVAAVIVAGGLTIVAGYFVVTAPTLFAEIVLDSLLVGGLYRRIRSPEQEAWFNSALRRTWVPALVAILLLTLLGVAFWGYAPDASSIGGVIEKWHSAH
jgi:hypothetical protein